ncbi:MAG TPA: glycosyltransferase family 1 protein, partial [Gemmataceae bacterium]|nr:glycosyltransferase family 1 protein [Gemmataceae bacterium]
MQILEPPPQRTSPGADVLRGRDILCFSHDWSGDPLSRTHLMRLLARDNRVLWVNSIGYRAPTISKADMSRAFKKLIAAASPLREPEPNIHVVNPLIIPAHGRPRIRTLNRQLLRWQVKRAMRRLGFRQPVSWVSNPAAAFIAGCFGEDCVIYHCVDENTAFSGVAAQALAEQEEQLIRRADLVVVTSERLYQSKSQFSPRTVLVRHGVDFEHFRQALNPATGVPNEIAGLPRPVIGFFGLVADWVDVELIAHVAQAF